MRYIFFFFDWLYELMRGIDTAPGLDSLKDDVKGDRSLNKDMIPYEPISYGRLGRMIAALRLGPEDVFVDLGCGKGRVVIVCARSAAGMIRGLELDPVLAQKARENIGKAGKGDQRISIIEGDAAGYAFADETVIFLFNPFGEQTMRRVAANILASLERNPRRLRIVYYNAQLRKVFDDQKWLVHEQTLEKGACEVWCTSEAIGERR